MSRLLAAPSSPLLHRLYTPSKILTAMRLSGAVDFDLPEQKVELKEDGLPDKLVRRERWRAIVWSRSACWPPMRRWPVLPRERSAHRQPLSRRAR